MDLYLYKLVFNNISTKDTPVGPLILLEGHRVFISLVARQEILTTLHEYHSTYDSMFRLDRNSIFWPTMKQNLSKLYDSCNTCQINRRAKIDPPPVPKLEFAKLSPMDALNLDFAQFGGKYFIVAADPCSGFVFVMEAATSNQSTDSALQFLHHIGSVYSYPT